MSVTRISLLPTYPSARPGLLTLRAVCAGDVAVVTLRDRLWGIVTRSSYVFNHFGQSFQRWTGTIASSTSQSRHGLHMFHSHSRAVPAVRIGPRQRVRFHDAGHGRRLHSAMLQRRGLAVDTASPSIDDHDLARSIRTPRPAGPSRAVGLGSIGAKQAKDAQQLSGSASAQPGRVHN